MLHIPQEIKQMLQRNLSPTAIDFLNEKFREYEEYCHELKELKQEVRKLKEMEDKAPQQIGYQYPKGRSQYEARYKPWYEEPYKEDEVEFEARRGRTRYEARRGTRSEAPQYRTTISNRQGGGRTSSEHIEEPYPKRKRVIPIYEEERTTGRDDGEAIE